MKTKLKEVRDFLICLLIMVGGFFAVLYFGSFPAQAAEKWTELGEYKITHYCAEKCCSSGTGITASGDKVQRYRTIAMKGVPFHTIVYIDTYGYREVQDRGVGDGTIDVYTDSHQHALELGVQHQKVWIVDGITAEDIWK